MEEFDDLPTTYKLGYEIQNNKNTFCIRNKKCILGSSITFFLFCWLVCNLLTLFLVIYGLNEYRGAIGKAEDIKNNVDNFINNITNLKKDISIYTDLAAVIIKHKKDINDFFLFKNNTQVFIKEAKGCINKYDICPRMS